MYKYRIDVLAISETCLDSTVMNCDLAIPAYTLYRRDQADRRKGVGVAMYVQEQLKSRQLQVNDRLETIFVGLHTHSRTNPFLSIGCVYRAPDSHVDFWEQLDNSVQMASATCPDILLLLGDYNVNMLSVPPHPNARYVQGLCADHSLQNVILQPTRVPSQSCLDLALIPTTMTTAAPSSSPRSLHSTFVHSVDGLSDHHLIGLSVRVSRANFEQPREQFSRRRQPSLAHLDRWVTSAALKHILDPSDVSGGYTLNAAASHWQQSVMTVLDDLAPFVTQKRAAYSKPRPQPWVTPELKQMFHRRSSAHRALIKHPMDDRLRQQYHAIRRQGTLLNRKLKSVYYKDKFSAATGNPRLQWAVLNQLTGRRKSHPTPKASLSSLSDILGNIVHDEHRAALTTPDTLADDCLDNCLLEFQPVTTAAVTKILERLNTTKASGSDGIPAYILKHHAAELANSLTSIFNQSLSNGKVPSAYKLASVCPVFKKGDPYDSSNYRPVSLLPIISKVLESLVLQQLHDHLDITPGAIPNEQFAYRRNHSTEDLLTLAINNRQRSMDTGDYTAVLLLDMSKAFDRVHHQTLIDDLHNLKIRGNALEWFKSYLSHRQQRVEVNGTTSDCRTCTRGVPQGSVLGPTLFSIYTRLVPTLPLRSQCLLYADDTTLYASGKCPRILMSYLEGDFSVVKQHLTDRGLLLNSSKSQVLLIHSRRSHPPPNLSIVCGSTVIAPSDEVKYLGLTLDSTLSFSAHVNSLREDIGKKLGAFRRGRRNLAVQARRQFYLSVVQSKLEYASTAYVHCLADNVRDQLLRISKRALRCIFEHDTFTRTSYLLERYHIISLDKRYHTKSILFVFRCIHNICSSLLSDMFSLRRDCAHTDRVTRGQVKSWAPCKKTLGSVGNAQVK